MRPPVAHPQLVLGLSMLLLPQSGRAGHSRVTHGWSSAVEHLEEAEELHFLLNGDWGCGRLKPSGECKDHSAAGQLAVAAAMGADADLTPVSFIVNTGDAMYPYGVRSLDDPKFADTFTSVYTAAGLQRPWYGVLGNHDWKNNASALVTKHQNWRIPALSYVLKGSVGGVHVTLFFIDTNIGNKYEICHERNVSQWDGFLTHADYDDCIKEIEDVFTEQRPWFIKALEEASEHVKIVVAHEPVYGSGKYAFTSPRKYPETLNKLDDELGLILQKYKVHAYFSGHDHLLQHNSYKGVHHYIVGYGGAWYDDHIGFWSNSNDVRVHPEEHVTISREGVFGYARASVNATHLCVQFIEVKEKDASRHVAYIHCSKHPLGPHAPATTEPIYFSSWSSASFVVVPLLAVCVIALGVAVVLRRRRKFSRGKEDIEKDSQSSELQDQTGTSSSE